MRKRRHILYGLMFRPSSRYHKENEKTIYSSPYAVKSDFKVAYQDHMAAMQIVAMSAKIYVMKNWHKVKNWSDMEISVVDNSGKETYYYNYNFKDKARLEKRQQIKTGSKYHKKAVRGLYARKKALHNPVNKISGFVYDISDQDFSLTINNKGHNWIDDESIIVLADYIESQINLKKHGRITTR